MQQTHLFISGSVQGVGYRQFVKHWARKFGLTGWVRNLDDGRVEAVVQGEPKKIHVLLKICRKGPPVSKVAAVQVQEESGSETFEAFTVLK